MWTGQDWAFLLGGITVLVTGIGGLITQMVTLHRVGNVAIKVDGMLVTRDASNVAAGTLIGRKAGDEASAQRAEGRRQERESHREAAATVPLSASVPLPVADDRAATIAERGAVALESLAAEVAAEKKL